MTTSTTLAGLEWPPETAARRRRCPVCDTEPGVRCQSSGDHLGRYLTAYNAGELPREGMRAAVIAAAANSPVVDEYALVPSLSRAAPQDGADGIAASIAGKEHQP